MYTVYNTQFKNIYTLTTYVYYTSVNQMVTNLAVIER